MSLKRLLFMLCAVAMMGSVTIFAEEKDKEIYVEKQVNIRNGNLIFDTKSEEHKMDCRCYPILDICIKENQTGVLQNGDIIYFETSRNGENCCISRDLVIETKGLLAEEINSQKENEFAIRILRKDTKELAEIKLYGEIYLSGTCNVDNLFSLKLNTETTKKDNLFSGKEDIVLNEQFLKILASDRTTTKIKDFPTLMFMAGENNMSWNEEKRTLKYPVYVNQNNMAMLSIDDFLNIMQSLSPKYIGVITVRRLDNDGYVIARGQNIFSIDLNIMLINDNGICRNDILIEKKEGVYYISLRGAAELFGMEDYLVWNGEDKTISIGAKF